MHNVSNGIDVFFSLLDDPIVKILFRLQAPIVVAQLKFLLLHLTFEMVNALVVYAFARHGLPCFGNAFGELHLLVFYLRAELLHFANELTLLFVEVSNLIFVIIQLVIWHCACVGQSLKNCDLLFIFLDKTGCLI